jgi:hypothetical protein
MELSPTSSNNPWFGKVKAFRQRKHIPRYSFKAPFTISSYAFRTQKWTNLTRDDVLHLRKTQP